jgi:hypothetical protein
MKMVIIIWLKDLDKIDVAVLQKKYRIKYNFKITLYHKIIIEVLKYNNYN